MAKRPIIVNVSRGGRIDTNALIDGVKSGAVLGAGLDVLASEPEIPSALASLEACPLRGSMEEER